MKVALGSLTNPSSDLGYLQCIVVSDYSDSAI